MSESHDPKTGRFLTGNNVGPGRPKGSRNKLGEVFLEALVEDFDKHGIKAIQDMRADDPGAYVRVIASILPKEFTVNPAADMDDHELDQRIRQLAKGLDLQVGVAGSLRGKGTSVRATADKGKPH